ncbi:Aldo-keto reductase, partial [Operophtera brumata]
MEGVLKANLTRAIGVSNFNEEQLGRLLNNAAVKPVCNQFENSVVPVAYTPLGLISEARPEFIGLDAIKTDPKLGELAH